MIEVSAIIIPQWSDKAGEVIWHIMLHQDVPKSILFRRMRLTTNEFIKRFNPTIGQIEKALSEVKMPSA